MDFFKQPIFYVIIVVAIAVAAIWTSITDRKTPEAEQQTTATVEETKISNLTNLPPGDFESIVRDEYNFSLSKAVLFNPIFKLSEIEVTIDDNLTPESVDTRYIFSSASDTVNNWMISISAVNQSFLRALVPKEDYAGNLTEIDMSLCKYNYVTALQLAEQFGGLSWREQNTLTGVKITLKNVSDRLIWIVEYSASSETKTIKLDANSGKMVEN